MAPPEEPSVGGELLQGLVQGAEFERYAGVANMVTKAGRVRARFHDLVLKIKNVEYFCEVKRWLSYPPGFNALEDALDQLRRDIVLANTASSDVKVTNLRWILPEPLSSQRARIIKDLQDGLTDSTLRSGLRKALRERFPGDTPQQITARVNSAITTAKNRLANDIVVFLP